MPVRFSTLLVWLVMAVAVPSLGVGIVATYHAVTQVRAVANARLTDAAHALGLAVSAGLGRMMSAAEAFATAPVIGENAQLQDLDVLDAHARMIARQLGVAVSIARPDGNRVLATRSPPHAVLPPVRDTDFVRRVAERGTPMLNNVAVGSLSGRPVITAGAPIFDVSGRVVLIALLVMDAGQIRNLLSEEGLPDGLIATVIDGKGIIAARSNDVHDSHSGQPVMPETAARLMQAKEGLFRATARDGVDRQFAFSHIPATAGWTVTVSQPGTSLDAAWRHSFAVFALGSAAVLGAGLLLALAVARRMLRPMAELTAHADAIAAGDLAYADMESGRVRAVPPTGVVELESLRLGFLAAEAALRRLVLAERRVSADLAVRQAELRALFEASPIGIARCGFDGRILDANDVVRRLLNTTASELAEGRLRLDDLTPPEYRHLTVNAIAEALAAPDGRCTPYEKELLRSDGSRVPVLKSVVVLDRTNREVAAFIVDLTDIRWLDERLAESEARHRELLATMFEGIIVADEDQRIISVNPAAVRIFGYDSEAGMVGRPLTILMPDSQAEQHEAYLQAHRQVGGSRILGGPGRELVARRRDGTVFPVEVSVSSFQSGGKRFFTGVLRDATERKAAEAALRDSEARYAALARATREGIAIHDQGRIIDCNDSLPRMLGYREREDVLGLMPRDYVAADALEAVMAQVLGESEEPYESLFRRADGSTFPVQVRGHAVHYQGRRVRVGVVQDLTQQKAAEAVLARDKAELERIVAERTRALRETESRLAQAAKMEALGRLAGGVAHDFNNVLQAVQGGIDLALGRLEAAPDRARGYLGLAADAASRGSAVTGRLLAFARRTELTAVSVDPSRMLDDLGALLRHALGPEVTLHTEVAPGVPHLLADSGQLETVLVNLANNARDALHLGRGTIWLRASADDDVPGLPPGRYVRLSVADDGVGMPPDVLARVTEPFFTTKPKGHGTGLGLAMARGFAEQSGGALAIDSSDGGGTTVSLWLPAAGAPAAEPETSPRVAARTASVLMVDDEPAIRTTLAQSLRDEGHAVVEALDGISALRLLEDGAAVDVVVTDLSMPGATDGLNLIREMRARHARLPAVLITGHLGDARAEALEDVQASGPFMLVNKPFTADVLASAVALVLGGAG